MYNRAMRYGLMFLLPFVVLAYPAYAQDKPAASPEIHRVVSQGDVRQARRLLDADPALLGLVTSEGIPPIFYAKTPAMARLLLQRGADIYTPAGANNLVPISYMKQQYGSDVAAVLDEYDVIMRAVHQGDLQFAKEQLASRLFLATSRNPVDGATLLHAAVLWGDTEFCRRLIELGADTTAEDTGGWPPITYSATWGESSTYQLLTLEFGLASTVIAASVNDEPQVVSRLITQDPSSLAPRATANIHPLHMAARAGRADNCQVLIDAGVDLDPATNTGWTPLHFATRHGHTETVKALLDAGASPIATTEDQVTPLMLACISGNPDVVRELLKASGDSVSKTNKQGGTAFNYAAQFPNRRVFELLLDAGADPDGSEDGATRPLIEVCRWGDLELVDRLLDVGADPTKTDLAGDTPLHAAARAGYAHIVDRLLTTPVPLDLKNRQDMTALHYAVQNDDAITSHMLLSRGASSDIRNGRRRTPRQIAEEDRMRNALIAFDHFESAGSKR